MTQPGTSVRVDHHWDRRCAISARRTRQTTDAGPVADCTTNCFVDAVAGSDTLNHGTSTSDAFQTIEKGVDTVAAGGTVHVAAGLYNPNDTDVTKSLGVATLATAADVADCLVCDHRCRVANLLDASEPRGAELLSQGALTP